MWDGLKLFAPESALLALWVFGAAALTIVGLLHFREKLPSWVDRLIAWFFACSFFVALRPLGIVESLACVAVMLVFLPFLSSSKVVPILALSLAIGLGAGLWSGYGKAKTHAAAQAELEARPAPTVEEAANFDPNVFFHSRAVLPGARHRMLDIDAGGAPLQLPVPQGYDYHPDAARPAGDSGVIASGAMDRDGRFPMFRFSIAVRDVPPMLDGPARLAYVREQYRRLDSFDAVRVAIGTSTLDTSEDIRRVRTIEMNTAESVVVYQRTDIANSRRGTSSLQASARAVVGGRVLDIDVEANYLDKDGPQPIDKEFIMSWMAALVRMNGG